MTSFPYFHSYVATGEHRSQQFDTFRLYDLKLANKNSDRSVILSRLSIFKDNQMALICNPPFYVTILTFDLLNIKFWEMWRTSIFSFIANIQLSSCETICQIDKGVVSKLKKKQPQENQTKQHFKIHDLCCLVVPGVNWINFFDGYIRRTMFNPKYRISYHLITQHQDHRCIFSSRYVREDFLGNFHRLTGERFKEKKLVIYEGSEISLRSFSNLWDTALRLECWVKW